MLSTAVAGGNPPDLASVSQPGLVQHFPKKGALKPIDYAKGAMAANFRAVVAKLGTFNGKLYGLVFKASQQVDRLVQRPRVQERRRFRPDDGHVPLIKNAGTIHASGVPPSRSAAPTAASKTGKFCAMKWKIAKPAATTDNVTATSLHFGT